MVTLHIFWQITNIRIIYIYIHIPYIKCILCILCVTCIICKICITNWEQTISWWMSKATAQASYWDGYHQEMCTRILIYFCVTCGWYIYIKYILYNVYTHCICFHHLWQYRDNHVFMRWAMVLIPILIKKVIIIKSNWWLVTPWYWDKSEHIA